MRDSDDAQLIMYVIVLMLDYCQLIEILNVLYVNHTNTYSNSINK